MTTILVANRSEVALRVFRTARTQLNMRCAAVYSEADEDSLFVRNADVAVPIGPPPPGESYLRIDRILDAAKEVGADLIHPGWGFLAEDAEFAEACAAAGFVFVGPPADVLRVMGSKDSARALAVNAGVHVLPGYSGEDQSDDTLINQAKLIGFPVMVKPAEGGGGKGMAVARNPDELRGAIESAQRISRAAFGDDQLLLEKFVDGARHVEVQILADTHGNVVHLGERDCSFQRRHQKVVEESPAPGISDEVRRQLWESATRLSVASGYQNAGTCEFVVGRDGEFGFIEMNARLQVEHAVTEEVTGLDLVEHQIRIARGELLPFSQENIEFAGHAIEARIYAEDPAAGFLPQAGRVEHLRWPALNGVRVDAGVEEGSSVTAYYDPLLAKIIVKGGDRGAVLSNLKHALAETEVLGVRSNVGFLGAGTAQEQFRRGEVTTDWLDSADIRHETLSQTPNEVLALAAAVEADRLRDEGTTARDPWVRLGSWRASGSHAIEVVLRIEDREFAIKVDGEGPFRVSSFTVEGIESVGKPERANSTDCHAWTVNGERAAAVQAQGTCYVWWRHRQFEVHIGPRERRAEETDAAHLEAPMPGQVIAVKIASGDKVARGEELVVVEAMKMEHTVRAPSDGVVTAVLCGPGDQVDRGQVLVEFEPA